MYLKQIAEILVIDNIPKTSTQAPKITQHPSAQTWKGHQLHQLPNVVAVVYNGMTLPRWNKGCKGWYETPYGSWGWNDWKSHPNKGKSEKGTLHSLRFAALKLVSCFVFGKMSEVTSWTVVGNQDSKCRGACHYIIYDIKHYCVSSCKCNLSHPFTFVCLIFLSEKTSSCILLREIMILGDGFWDVLVNELRVSWTILAPCRRGETFDAQRLVLPCLQFVCKSAVNKTPSVSTFLGDGQ